LQFLATITLALTASVFQERWGDVLAVGSNNLGRKSFSEEVIFSKIS
jgi:hypothetical protein